MSILRIYPGLGVSAEPQLADPPAAREHFMETHIRLKSNISPKQLEFWRLFFFAVAENHIFPNHIKVEGKPEKSHFFVANLTSGYNFEA